MVRHYLDNPASDEIKAETLVLIEQAKSLEKGRSRRRNIEGRICELNRGLVKLLANRYFYKITDSTTTFNDLMQVGFIGLLKAIDKFDPTLEITFSTHAKQWIVGEFKHYNRSNFGVIKVPVRWLDTLNAVRKLQKEWLKHGKHYELKDLAINDFGLKAHEWETIKQACKGIAPEEFKIGTEATVPSALDELINLEKEEDLLYSAAESITLSIPIEDHRILMHWVDGVEPKLIAKDAGLPIRVISEKIEKSIARLSC